MPPQSRELRRGALFLLVIAGVAVVGDRVAASVLDALLARSEFRFSRVYARRAAADVIVLGDSRAVNSVYAPSAERAIGRTVMNLGYNGMATELSEAVVLDLLERNRAPKLAVIEVTSVAREPDLVTALKLFAGFSPRLDSLHRVYRPTDARAVSVAHLFRYNSELFLRSAYYLGRSDQTWINRYEIGPAILDAVPSEPAWALEPQPKNVTALQRMVQRLRAAGTEVRLVIGPFLPAHAAHWSNREAFKAAVLRALPGERAIWDYTDAVTGDENFSDRVHLNERGSDVLLARLTRDGFFAPGASPASPASPAAAGGRPVAN